MSTLPVDDFATAQAIVSWYGCRWGIEIYLSVLKQGCKVEDLRLETDDRISNALGIYMIVAWRVHEMTMKSRERPQVTCDVVFSTQEWKTIYTRKNHPT